MKTLTIALLVAACCAIAIDVPAQTTTHRKTTVTAKHNTHKIHRANTVQARARKTTAPAQNTSPANGRAPVAKYHGPKNVTPGSPIGTGGAGGSDMSGSPAGSAIETKDQTSKAAINTYGQPVRNTHAKAKKKAGKS